MSDASRARSRATATADNALEPAERDALLAARYDARLATNRADGWPHLTPIWYVWDGFKLTFSLGATRMHLRNLRRDPRATFCVGVDHELSDSDEDSAQRYVVCFGIAHLIEPEAALAEVRRRTDAIMERYRGDRWREASSAVWSEARTLVELEPERWLTWDTGKA